MRIILMLGVFLWVSACAPHEVRCDAKLQPINTPARSVP